MMDIFIKSFGRPFYLERCLRSIQRFVTGEFRIILLDDGTDEKYIDQIKSRFPMIAVHLSPYANEKRLAVEKHLAGESSYSIKKIPVGFWREHIGSSAEYFLLLEEDAWLTGPLDVQSIASTMRTNRMVTLKIFWGNNEKIISGKIESLTEKIDRITPHVETPYPIGLKLLLRNSFRLRSLLTKARLLKKDWILPYYSLYTVSSAFFYVGYWNELWIGVPECIDETLQLEKALAYQTMHSVSYGKTNTEKAKTSFKTSAWNSLRSNDFDMIRFNHDLSEAWLNQRLEVMENFPLDFSTDYLSKFFQSRRINYNEESWMTWMEGFQRGYKSLGISID